ncbi:PEPxxWA-CTERM sorting domain-containing protein [Sphingomonas sp. MMSM20]|uniref:PEPxxWA-CTERM sorting domain-containing protein n=1 Tax=Sphingomonas lycopersici TaxID=2951807 RepID=UPI00223791D8|nr:PEPxxWA-CTERM sorting domain-containing protein [Sphingomonas lycopersici]MCW6530271.1 PEPxxWA-CTERM sorting domain-containing protein [Sphingomonas lycopersici]
MKGIILSAAVVMLGFAPNAVGAVSTVKFKFSGNLDYRNAYGARGSILNNALPCERGCPWTLSVELPDHAGPSFKAQSAVLSFGGESYSLSDFSAYSAYIFGNSPYDVMIMHGGVDYPVTGVPGATGLGFELGFNFPRGTLVASHQTPPTDPNLYLHGLLPSSFAYLFMTNFPGEAGGGESGLQLETFDPLKGPYQYPLTGFSVSGAFSSAVPEPAAWAMMVGGFGLMGAAVRRRRPVCPYVLT